MTLEEERFCMEPLQLAGQLIVENGGEIFRVEETVTRMGRAFGLAEVESFAVPSGLFVSYRLADGSAETAVRRLRAGDTNLDRVDRVNSVSRRVEAGELSPARAMAELKTIAAAPQPCPDRWLPAAAALCAAGFALMFGGRLPEFMAAGLTAALAQAGCMLLGRLGMRQLTRVLAGGILSALVPMLLRSLYAPLLLEATVAGALMPLVPGLAMTNAVQDTMRGDMVAGLSHGIQAILTACLIAGGALVASALAGSLAEVRGAVQAAEPSLILRILLAACSSLLGTLGFAALVCAPARSWLHAGAVGMAAFLIYTLVLDLGGGANLAIFLGSLAGSVLALLLARRERMISTVFLMMSIVPFVPGLGLYRCMRFIGAGDTAAGVQEGVAAMIAIAMIVIGQGFGSFLIRAIRR